MTLIVGLGNPGPKYNYNRHNIGFRIIDTLLQTSKNFTSISKNSFKGDVFKHHDLLLLKPHTFMNLSGESVRAVKEYFHCDKVLAIHDELEHPFGSLRFKCGGGHGGHNGLRSIDEHISNTYCRIRFGIGKPLHKEEITSHVLGDFNKIEREHLDALMQKAADAALFWVSNGIEKTAATFTQSKLS